MTNTLLDWRTITDEREKYAAYLCSPEWGRLRAAVHERAGGVCERCKRAPIDAVHHLTYQRKYKEELVDLQGICNPCHEFTHGKSRDDPSNVFDPLQVQNALLICPKCKSSKLALKATVSSGPLARIVIDCVCGGQFSACFVQTEGEIVFAFRVSD